VIHAVVDTNLALRMAAGRQRSPLYVAWRGRRFTLVVSTGLLREFETVTARPAIRRFLPPSHGQEFVTFLRATALWVNLAPEFPHCRDSHDDIVVATAIAARPCYLVTADRDLYDDPRLVTALRDLDVRVVQSGEFLAAL